MPCYFVMQRKAQKANLVKLLLVKRKIGSISYELIANLLLIPGDIFILVTDVWTNRTAELFIGIHFLEGRDLMNEVSARVKRNMAHLFLPDYPDIDRSAFVFKRGRQKGPIKRADGYRCTKMQHV